jgi:hypothetical protein
VENTPRRTLRERANIPRTTSPARILGTYVVIAALLLPVILEASIPLFGARHTRQHFRATLPESVRADHPAILPVAAAIRAITQNPLEQIVMVNDVSHLLVDYDHDERVYGAVEFHATFDEMLTRRRQAGWLYLRDDCDGRAIFAAHLLSALGIPWRLEASYWKEHAWISALVDGTAYDLLDLRRDAPETKRLSYSLFGRFFVRPSNRPPAFAWRRAWAQNTGRDLQLGLTLGMLSLDSRPNAMQERYATDWTRRAPHGRLSPIDDRALTTHIAGFPLGEPLHASAFAADTPPSPRLHSEMGGVPTASPTSSNE